ncbi:hypothetical protein A3C89_03340 [Candidatus Kaiserbacteria bacterium RIFCSPHIGHO2_02_FULL_50_50]|uniref:GlcNAc-PI de-N-acetylase n=1 Tax=Candidatus Kaiserbacteria bacterium RIFCSPHIGHO2_02_FULL_50_50 TaxID=1798492 RepID=A0A1F6DEU4_9BACT|nr:MAG: hypothetical protein A3C89_03340 [Candidatus Kaiserbacteria bacterium RIFCSPHIGHO2_02_FULL_50_50]OGG89237.1 MAG: hypothetical protein A3G62_01280 [Candidatus Kaiserbacteria bacterium RIFCSPLOWO2_12_FULL_50_10]
MKKILAVGAHPDDIELGCGGTIARHVDKGDDVYCVILTRGEHGATDVNRHKETLSALRVLGVPEDNILVHDFPDRELFKHLNGIITVLEDTARRYAPHRVYTMFKGDRHQDHRTTYEASAVAYRKVPQVLCYETPSAWPAFDPQIFINIGEFSGRKMDALRCHESQMDRDYMKPETLEIAARFHAQQIGLRDMCEAFMVHKMILD